MIRLPRACRGRAAVRFPANSSHMCCVELALKGLASAKKCLVQGVFPCHWSKAKPPSMAGTVRVIWVCACVWVGVFAPCFDLLVICDPLSLRMSWWNLCAVPSQQLPHVLCGAGT